MLKGIKKKLTLILTISMGLTIATSFSGSIKVDAATSVNVNVSSTRQRMSGFGASSAWCGALSDGVMDTLYRDIGLSILRVRMEPNEGWSRGDYRAWNDELSNARKAKARGALVFATPWTAPASMKSNNSTRGTGGATLKQERVGDYAKYLESYADHFANNGVPLYAISLQNEPDWTVDYDGCRWTGEQFRTFLRAFGASLSKKAKIMMPESLGFNHALSDPALNDPEACKYASIVGGHLYGAKIQDYPLARQKGKELWMTELYETDQSLKGSLDFAKKIHDCLTVGNMSAYVYWWLNNTDENSLIDRQNRPYHRAFILGQFSKFIRYGYNRVDATSNPQGNVYTSAYTGDGKVVIVAINQNTYPVNQTFNVQNTNLGNVSRWVTSGSQRMAKNSDVPSNNGNFTTSLPAQSVTTFVCSKSGASTNPSSAIKTNAYYRIKNVNSGMYLGVTNSNNGAQTVQTSAINDSSIWQVVNGEDNGYVKLAVKSGEGKMVLDIPNGSNDNAKQLDLWQVNGGGNQEFRLKDNGDGSFGILTKLSDDTKGLDVNNNSKDEKAPIIQYDYRATANQKWIFEEVKTETPGETVKLEEGWYNIKNVHAQKYLQVEGNNGRPTANIELRSANGSDGQRWYLRNVQNGYITLTSALGEYMIDISAAEDKDGANVQIYNGYAGNSQQFMLKKSKTNGAYIIATKCSGLTKVLDDTNFSKADGTNVCQWTYGGEANQQWIFERVR